MENLLILAPLEAKKAAEYILQHPNEHILLKREIPIEMGELTYISNSNSDLWTDITDYDSF